MKQISYVSSKINPQTAWDRLSLAEQAEMMKVAVSKGYTNLYDIKDKYNEFASGGEIEEELPPATPFGQRVEVVITPDQEYNQYLNTLPDNQRFTPNDRYDSYLYWKLNGKPKNFQEAYQKGMFHFDHSDNAYHANSIAFGNDGIGYFMKPKTHDTVGFETDWYNHGIVTEEGGIRRPVNEEERRELEEFRRNYKLIDDPYRSGYFMYVPIQKSFGGNLRGPIVETAMNEYKDGGGIHIKPSHRGRLTELKARTGKSEAELYNDGNPAHKKMVVFARNARKWHGFGGNLFYPGGEITYGKPFYSYDENGQKIDNTLNYNATIPEIVIIPDSRKTPAQRNEDERFRQRSLKDYDEDKSKEFTTKQVLQSQKDWENSFEKQALDYAQAAATGVGIGSDIVSGLPIYSSLKGTSILSRAETPMDYVEGSLWLTPVLGSVYHTAKPVVKQITQTAFEKVPSFEMLDFGNVEDGAFKFSGFKEDPLQMHLKRAQAKGYDTSGIEIYDLSKDSPENTALIEAVAKKYGLTPEQTKTYLMSHLDKFGHAGNFKDTKIILHDGTNDNLSARISHEVDHLLHIPDEPIPDGSYYPRILKRPNNYFTARNNTEIAARGSQLHDYYGHTGNEPITEDMLEYARQHYIQDTGLDNDMHDFLWTIKDNKKVADWLTKYATGITPFGLFGAAAYNQKDK